MLGGGSDSSVIVPGEPTVLGLVVTPPLVGPGCPYNGWPAPGGSSPMT